MKTKRLLELSAVAAIYVALTFASYPFAFGLVQFRISEILVLLCFYRKDYAYSLVIGTFIVNLFNPIFNPVADAFIGSFATFISVIGVMYSKKLIVASVYPVVFNAVIIGVELAFFLELSYLLAIFSVGFGQFVVISIFGIVIFKRLEKNPNFMRFIKANQNYKFIE